MGRALVGAPVLLAAGVWGSCALPAAPASREPSLARPPASKIERAACAASAPSCGQQVAQAPAGDTPVNIISDQIRRQGYACDEPRQAERDQEASRPNLTVWILRCGNANYRVTLIPDMAARVERLP